MHTHILIPTDGSELSERAVNYGVALAKAVNAKVTGVTVSTPFQFTALEPRMTTDTLESYTSQMSTVAAQRLHGVKSAASVADLECDLIVMASHGRRGIAAIVLGRETVKVLTHCTIPVLVYREPQAKGFFATWFPIAIQSRHA